MIEICCEISPRVRPTPLSGKKPCVDCFLTRNVTKPGLKESSWTVAHIYIILFIAAIIKIIISVIIVLQSLSDMF